MQHRTHTFLHMSTLSLPLSCFSAHPFSGYIYMYMHVCTYVHMYICTHVHIDTSIHRCPSCPEAGQYREDIRDLATNTTCKQDCVCVCIICVCIYIYIYSHTCTCVCIYIYIYKYKYISLSLYIYIYMHTYYTYTLSSYWPLLLPSTKHDDDDLWARFDRSVPSTV